MADEYDSGILIEISDDSESESESSSDTDHSVIVLTSDSDSEHTSESASELIFVDLRCKELVNDKQHNAPNATVDELSKISDQFVKTLDTEDDDKILNYSNVTIRKRNRFRTKNNEETKRQSAQIITKKPSEPAQSNPVAPEIQANQIPAEKPSESVQNASVKIQAHKSFLESLDDKVPLELAHPESLKFKKHFKKHRNELVDKLTGMYNEQIFENKLSQIPLTWTKWIGYWGGCCEYFKSTTGRDSQNYASICLNEVFMTSAERVRDVLLHEMCHAAVFMINKHRKLEEHEGHGPLWQSWGQLAKKVFPDVPLINRYHYYEMTHKYKYKCTICWGSSLSKSKLKNRNIFCALCHGPVQLYRIKIKNGRRVTVALRKPGSFALFVKENYKLVKRSDITHAGVMKELSEKYSNLTFDQKIKYRQSFAALK